MDTLLHHSILAAADADADREAFRCRELSLSYGDLAKRSSRLASALLEGGLKPMDRVGIFMNKGLEMPIAVYGILMAGCAYVPIDPSAPASRIRFILQDCGIKTLVTHESKRRQVAQVAAEADSLQRIIGLDTPFDGRLEYLSWNALSHLPQSCGTIRIHENDLAYIMYTSGSTGTPKGLMHTHRSGLTYAQHAASCYGVETGDRLGNHAPLHFDISTFEFLAGPLHQATSILIPEESLLFPASMAALIEKEKLTFWYSVPGALIQLLSSSATESCDLTSLRWVLFGGEPFPKASLEALMQRLPQARFANVYGPAEVNQCTHYEVPQTLGRHESIPIGKIWDGAKGTVVDRFDKPVAPGESGELLVHSSSMMAGYWNRPDLDQHAFAKRETTPGFFQTYYRTGDIVSEDEEGVLHFVGRKDRQIKIRGYRLELDEVEAVLAASPAVAECAVVAIENEAKEKTIVAVVTLNPDVSLCEADLVAFARGKLPHYGIPERIEMVGSLPRTTSGKIDRKRLALNLSKADASQLARAESR